MIGQIERTITVEANGIGFPPYRKGETPPFLTLSLRAGMYLASLFNSTSLAGTYASCYQQIKLNGATTVLSDSVVPAGYEVSSEYGLYFMHRTTAGAIFATLSSNTVAVSRYYIEGGGTLVGSVTLQAINIA